MNRQEFRDAVEKCCEKIEDNVGYKSYDAVLEIITLFDLLQPPVSMAFHKWMVNEGWHEHSSKEYWYRSEDFHKWPPDETASEEELVNKFLGVGKTKQIKSGELFECEGRKYIIKTLVLPTQTSNLENGQSIFTLVEM